MRQELALVPEDELSFEIGLAKRADNGYGNDPNLRTPSAPWSGTLSAHELDQIEALSDIFLPRTSDDPAPSEVGIRHFFDHWLSAPYPRQRSHKATIVRGLSFLDPISKTKYKRPFLQLSRIEMEEIVASMQTSWPERNFFGRFRYLVVGGYFTTAAGSSAIGYKGNVPLLTYSGMSDEIEAIVEAELRKLGL